MSLFRKLANRAGRARRGRHARLDLRGDARRAEAVRERRDVRDGYGRVRQRKVLQHSNLHVSDVRCWKDQRGGGNQRGVRALPERVRLRRQRRGRGGEPEEVVQHGDVRRRRGAGHGDWNGTVSKLQVVRRGTPQRARQGGG